MALKGFDISHWNKIIDYDEVEGNFVILKATEGVSFIDPAYKKNVRELRKRKKLIGHYHFAKGEDYKKEAKHFLDNADLQKGDIIALDFEIQLDNPVAWCYQWLLEIQKKTGIKPLIYLNVSTIYKYNWANVIENGNGLWIADYKNLPARIGKWKFWAVRQTTALGDSKGIIGSVDRDIFNGNKEQWRAYGYQKSPQSTENEAVSDENCKELQSTIEHLKASLEEYMGKNRKLKETIGIQAETIADLESVNQRNAKNVKVIDSFVFFIKSIIFKLK